MSASWHRISTNRNLQYNDNKRQKYKRRGNLDRCNGLERSILNVYFRISKTMSTSLLKLHVPVELTPPPRRSSRDVRRPAYSPELCACYFEQQLLSWKHLRVALTAILAHATSYPQMYCGRFAASKMFHFSYYYYYYYTCNSVECKTINRIYQHGKCIDSTMNEQWISKLP
jgi:hypothetical protein